MSFGDLGNAFFEGVGAILSWKNVSRLLRDRQIKGVYWPATAFWALWGLWNLYYYPSLGQWASTTAGAVLVAGNLVWVLIAVRLWKSNAVERARPRPIPSA